MKKEWVVVNDECRIVFNGSKIACKAFMHDNTYIYKEMRLKLAKRGRCVLI